MRKFDVNLKLFRYLDTKTLLAIPLHGSVFEHPKPGETVRVVVPQGNVAIMGKDCTVRSISVNRLFNVYCFYANVEAVEDQQ